MEITDKVLVRRLAAGNLESLESLYERHAALLAARLRQQGANREEAEDVLQETFIDVWNMAGSFRAESSVSAWLWGIASRKFSMLIRSEVRLRDRQARASSPEAVTADLGAGLDTAQAFQDLAPEMAAAFKAVVIDGMSTREASTILGIPEGTVKSRVHRARRAMREEMQ